MEYIPFGTLFGVENVKELNEKLCEKNVCGNKVMCFWNGDKVIKEMRESFNYGVDCVVVDEFKDLFGIRKMNSYRVASDARVTRIDPKESLWENNMKIVEEDTIYLVMDRFENIGSLSKSDRRDLPNIAHEFLKIVIFRGIFRVTDTNYRNVLINDKDELMSIDENHIGKKDSTLVPVLRIQNYTKNQILGVVSQFQENIEEKVKKIKQVMSKYKLGEDLIESTVNNLIKLRENVESDISKFWGTKLKESATPIKNKNNQEENAEGAVAKTVSSVDKRQLRIFGSISYNGFRDDLLKSCIQKYARRGNFDKGVYFLVELDLFQGYTSNGVSGERIRSNMRNRLLIILGEDIGSNDWRMWMRCKSLIESWEKTRDSEESRVYLVNFYLELCNAQKYRECNFTRAFYGRQSKEFNKKFLEKYPEYAHRFNYEVSEGFGKNFYKAGDDPELKKYIDGFVKCFVESNEDVFYWFFMILGFEGAVGARNRRKKSIFVIWNIIDTFVENEKNQNMISLKNTILQWVLNNNNSRNENWLWVMCMAKFYMKRNKIDWSSNEELPLSLNKETVDKIYQFNIEFNTIEPDSWCIDRHTGEGRNAGKDHSDFVKEGMMVTNENPEMKELCEMYLKFYIMKKLE